MSFFVYYKPTVDFAQNPNEQSRIVQDIKRLTEQLKRESELLKKLLKGDFKTGKGKTIGTIVVERPLVVRHRRIH